MSIKITKLYKFYDKKEILSNINLEIKSGEVFGLMGLNGAGKTTLISILNYIEKCDKGEILINDLDMQTNQKQIKNISSYVPQNFAFYPKLSAFENLEFFASMFGLKGKKAQNTINEVLELCLLANQKNTKASKYSGGYKRRLNLAIAMLNKPQILYLDEVCSGVDLQSKKSILQTIKNINLEHKTTIIFTSHHLDEIEFLCEDIALLHKGRIVLHEKKDKILSTFKSLESIFLEMTKESFA